MKVEDLLHILGPDSEHVSIIEKYYIGSQKLIAFQTFSASDALDMLVGVPDRVLNAEIESFRDSETHIDIFTKPTN